MAGYSQPPLAKKLGIVEGARVAILSPPTGFLPALEPLPAGVRLDRELPSSGDLDVIVLFCQSKNDLEKSIRHAASILAPGGGLWIAWPKKASRLQTDLAFASVQAMGLKLGLVDNKVCAVDDVFSSLRFVVRRENRESWAMGRRV